MLKAFATFDSKAAAFGNPIFLPTTGLASRMFVEACAEPTSTLRKYPQDYSLYEIGSYDPSTAEMKGFKPRPIMTAAAAVEMMLAGKKASEDIAKACQKEPKK